MKETRIEGDTIGRKQGLEKINVERKEERNEQVRKLGEERREGTD